MKNILSSKTISIYYLLTLVLLISGCSKKDSEINAGRQVIKITVQPVESRLISYRINASSILQAKQSAQLSFLQGGYLEAVYYDMGDHVNENDTLACLDTRALKSNLVQAEAMLEKAKRDLERAEELHSQNVLPVEGLQNAQTAFENAKAMQQSAQYALDHGYIIAPFSGSISARYQDAGQVVGPGVPVYGMVNKDKFEITAGIAENEIKYIVAGDPVKIFLSSDKSSEVKGAVKALPASGEITKGILPLKIECGNPGEWLPGMAVEMEITAGKKSRETVIPAIAVRVDSDGEAYCYKYRPEPGDVLKTPIQLGKPVDEGIIVNSGIEPGDLVVCGGVDRVRDGDRVELEDEGTDR